MGDGRKKEGRGLGKRGRVEEKGRERGWERKGERISNVTYKALERPLSQTY